MELRPGYKATEIGIVPEEWDVQPLAARGPFAKGSGIRKDQAASGSIPCVRYGELYTDHHEIIQTFPSRISQGVARTARRLNVGDVIFAASGETKEEIGKCAAFVDDLEAYAGGDTIIFSPRCDDSYFLGYALNQPIAARQKAARGQGDAVVHISARSLGNIKLPFPPVPEQRAIAEALSDVDASIAALSRLIAKKRDLRQGAMQRLLTGHTRLPGFTAPWQEKRLGQCLLESPSYGINAPAVPFSDRLPRYIRITDISEDGRFDPRPLVSVAAASSRYLLEPGDLVFARTGASVGKSYLYEPADGELVYAGFLIRVRPNPKLLVSKFLAGLTTTKAYWNWVKLMSMRSGQPGINGQEYAQFGFRCPEPDEQAAISQILADMDAEIAAHEARLDKTRALKQAMMQALLTGRVRLPARRDVSPQTKEAAHA